MTKSAVKVLSPWKQGNKTLRVSVTLPSVAKHETIKPTKLKIVRKKRRRRSTVKDFGQILKGKGLTTSVKSNDTKWWNQAPNPDYKNVSLTPPFELIAMLQEEEIIFLEETSPRRDSSLSASGELYTI